MNVKNPKYSGKNTILINKYDSSFLESHALTLPLPKRTGCDVGQQMPECKDKQHCSQKGAKQHRGILFS